MAKRMTLAKMTKQAKATKGTSMSLIWNPLTSRTVLKLMNNC